VLLAGLHIKTDQHLLLEACVSLNLTLIKGVKASSQVENSHCHANSGGRHVFVALVFLFSVTHSAWLGFSFQYPEYVSSFTSQSLSDPFRDEELAPENQLFYLCTYRFCKIIFALWWKTFEMSHLQTVGIVRQTHVDVHVLWVLSISIRVLTLQTVYSILFHNPNPKPIHHRKRSAFLHVQKNIT